VFCLVLFTSEFNFFNLKKCFEKQLTWVTRIIPLKNFLAIFLKNVIRCRNIAVYMSITSKVAFILVNFFSKMLVTAMIVVILALATLLQHDTFRTVSAQSTEAFISLNKFLEIFVEVILMCTSLVKPHF